MLGRGKETWERFRKMALDAGIIAGTEAEQEAAIQKQAELLADIQITNNVLWPDDGRDQRERWVEYFKEEIQTKNDERKQARQRSAEEANERAERMVAPIQKFFNGMVDICVQGFEYARTYSPSVSREAIRIPSRQEIGTAIVTRVTAAAATVRAKRKEAADASREKAAIKYFSEHGHGVYSLTKADGTVADYYVENAKDVERYFVLALQEEKIARKMRSEAARDQRKEAYTSVKKAASLTAGVIKKSADDIIPTEAMKRRGHEALAVAKTTLEVCGGRVISCLIEQRKAQNALNKYKDETAKNAREVRSSSYDGDGSHSSLWSNSTDPILDAHEAKLALAKANTKKALWAGVEAGAGTRRQIVDWVKANMKLPDAEARDVMAQRAKNAIDAGVKRVTSKNFRYQAATAPGKIRKAVGLTGGKRKKAKLKRTDGEEFMFHNPIQGRVPFKFSEEIDTRPDGGGGSKRRLGRSGSSV